MGKIFDLTENFFLKNDLSNAISSISTLTQAKILDNFTAQKTVHCLYHKVHPVQGPKYGTVPSNTVHLAGLPIKGPTTRYSNS